MVCVILGRSDHADIYWLTVERVHGWCLDTMAPPRISGYLGFIFVHWGEVQMQRPPLFGSMCRPGAGLSAGRGRVSPCSAGTQPSLEAAGGGQQWPSGQRGWCSTWRGGRWIWPPPEAPRFQLHTGQMKGDCQWHSANTGQEVMSQWVTSQLSDSNSY